MVHTLKILMIELAHSDTYGLLLGTCHMLRRVTLASELIHDTRSHVRRGDEKISYGAGGEERRVFACIAGEMLKPSIVRNQRLDMDSYEFFEILFSWRDTSS